MEESEHEEEEDAEDEIAVRFEILQKWFLKFSKVQNWFLNKIRNKTIYQAELEDDAWIQCEREECLKWRRVNNEIAEKYENENWYCELNPDKQFNR